MVSTQLSLEDLSVQVNDMRKLLIAAGLKKGFTDSETLKYSEELDKLIMQFQLQRCLYF
ncbi:aspartyl-phosphate phosphatase Spo0E family protein [Domibacillus aminovorans]|uniref:aspartyl-phosphate phosphatase Spo0E family protein n=1 Tax=Domibacillus aminovorans TaxID=29332 RepID=UPI0009ED34FC|nr:aspartyl-phosphate phosphatase Spo0E family protein [Domibacillus aminovorans]